MSSRPVVALEAERGFSVVIDEGGDEPRTVVVDSLTAALEVALDVAYTAGRTTDSAVQRVAVEREGTRTEPQGFLIAEWRSQ